MFLIVHCSNVAFLAVIANKALLLMLEMSTLEKVIEPGYISKKIEQRDETQLVLFIPPEGK